MQNVYLKTISSDSSPRSTAIPDPSKTHTKNGWSWSHDLWPGIPGLWSRSRDCDPWSHIPGYDPDINDLPNCLNAGAPRIYADDTNVTFSAVTIPDLEYQINSDLKYIDRWLKAQKFLRSRQKLQSLGLFERSSHRWFSDEYSHTANM